MCMPYENLTLFATCWLPRLLRRSLFKEIECEMIFAVNKAKKKTSGPEIKKKKKL